MEFMEKIIWAEGVLLSQQHLQEWDKCHAAAGLVYRQSVAPLAWGLMALQIDETALLNGRFKIKNCRAIYPHGLLVDYNDGDGSVLSCELSSNKAETIEIYLCMPINQNAKGISGYQQPQQLAGWKADYRNVADIYDTGRERQVLFGVPNLKLLSGDTAREQFYAMKIAELESNGDSQYQLIENYIPPLIYMQTSAFLKNMIISLLEIIMAKIRILRKQHVKNHLLLQTLHRTYISLRHILETKTHPEKLFLALSDFAGQLAVFVADEIIHELPKYQHEKLTVIFNKLNSTLIELLNSAMPARPAAIKLRRESESLYIADKIGAALFRQYDFFLGAYFVSQDAKWIEQFVRQVKIGSCRAINSITAFALPGVKITYMRHPPQKLPAKPEYEYFCLESAGDVWRQIAEDKNLAIFLPQTFKEATIELLTLNR